jgi:hypothetical protein
MGDTIKMDLTETGCDEVGWIHLILKWEQWWLL